MARSGAFASMVKGLADVERRFGCPPDRAATNRRIDAAVADSNTATKTLCRKANGVDSNNASVDWVLCNARTVGTANQP